MCFQFQANIYGAKKMTNKEETILIAMTQAEDGGKLLSEIMEIAQENPIFRMRFGSLEVQGHLTMSTIWNKKFFDSDHRLNVRVLPSIEKGTDMVRVHQLYNSITLPISALVKRPLNQTSDTWIAFLSTPSPLEGDIPAVIDRSPVHNKRWPTVHPIVAWNGSVVSIESSILSEELTPPEKEEDANFGVDSGWNTYRRYERRGRTNSVRSRTSNESDTGSGKK